MGTNERAGEQVSAPNPSFRARRRRLELRLKTHHDTGILTSSVQPALPLPSPCSFASSISPTA